MKTVESYLIPGNWRKFDSFCWFDRPDDADEFALVYTDNRDSDLIDKSNARIIAAALAEFEESGDVIPQSHSHWACGYVNGYAIRVYRDGELTPAAQAWDDMARALEDYPILDESDYSELECEAQSEAWDDWARRDFERGIERAFDCELDGELATDLAIFELFNALADRANQYWETESSGVYINVERIVEACELDDIFELVQSSALRIFENGEYLADGELKLGIVSHDVPLYCYQFERVQVAIDNGEDSAELDGKLLTWTIE